MSKPEYTCILNTVEKWAASLRELIDYKVREKKMSGKPEASLPEMKEVSKDRDA